MDVITGEEVAIKFAIEENHQYLEQEYLNYLYLGADGKSTNPQFEFEYKKNSLCLEPTVIQHGIPHVKYFGDFDEYKVLIMTRTGPTLHKIRNSIESKQFGIDVICKIAIQGVCIFNHLK